MARLLSICPGCRCGTTRSGAATDEATTSPGERPVLLGSSGPKQQVPIDKTTKIPAELYWDLVRAGELAKNRGQHQRIKEQRQHHLVISAN
jgi:hypothetical protein